MGLGDGTKKYDLTPRDSVSSSSPVASPGLLGRPAEIGVSGAQPAFQGRSTLQQHEVKGEMDYIRRIQRVGGREYRNAMRKGNNIGAMKAIDWMQGNGVRPRSGIEPHGALEQGVTQFGNWVHNQASGALQQQGQPNQPQPGPLTTANTGTPGATVTPGAAGVAPQPGTSGVAPLTPPQPGHPGGPPVAPSANSTILLGDQPGQAAAAPVAAGSTPPHGQAATGDLLARRQNVYKHMQSIAANGGDPESMRQIAIKSGAVPDDASFDRGLQTLGKWQERQSQGPLESRLIQDQTNKQAAAYEASTGYQPLGANTDIQTPNPPYGKINGEPAQRVLEGMQKTADAKDASRALPVDNVAEFTKAHQDYQSGLNREDFVKMQELRSNATPQERARIDAIAAGRKDPALDTTGRQGTYKGNDPTVVSSHQIASEAYQKAIARNAPKEEVDKLKGQMDHFYEIANPADQALITAGSLKKQGAIVKAEAASKVAATKATKEATAEKIRQIKARNAKR